MNIVIKLGGHIFFGEEGVNIELLREIADVILSSYDDGRWAVVVGGGGPARLYVKAARELGLDEAASDILAVRVTRVNALLFAYLLGEKSYPRIPETLEQLREYSSLGRIVVSGGLQPGQSTVAVSALAAEALDAQRLIIATDVDGVYTDDPKRNPEARLLKEITLSQLQKILEKTSHRAGEYKLIDSVALKVLSRSKIPTIYLNGKNPQNLLEAIRGENPGTLVKPE